MRRRSWIVVVVLYVLVMALPARAGPGPGWIGTWVDPNWGYKVTITPEGGDFLDSPTPTHYAWVDPKAVGLPPDDWTWPGTTKLPPGNYCYYDPTPVTRDEILARLAELWKGADHAPDGSDEVKYKKAQADFGAIPPGSYGQLRRFCVDDPKSGADCTPPDQEEFFILLGDRIMKIVLFSVAPEDSYTLTYQRR